MSTLERRVQELERASHRRAEMKPLTPEDHEAIMLALKNLYICSQERAAREQGNKEEEARWASKWGSELPDGDKGFSAWLNEEIARRQGSGNGEGSN